MTIFSGDPIKRPQQGIQSLGVGTGEYLSESAAGAFAEWPSVKLGGIRELSEAQGETQDLGGMIDRVQQGEDLADVVDRPKPIPQIPVEEAKKRVTESGLKVNLPDTQMMSEPALKIMMDRAQEHYERELTFSRASSDFIPNALSAGTSFLVGAVDPLNIAAAFIPVIGEARWASLMASAGQGVLARAGTRAGIGAAQGAAFSGAFIPLEAYAKTQEGQDYTMADALKGVIFNAALFGALHVVAGGGADIYRGVKGRELYPFAPGEPMGKVPIHEVPSWEHLADYNPYEVPELPRVQVAPIDTVPMLKIINDLPPKAKEDSMRAAIANLTQDEPVRVGEMLNAAAETDPRISEALEPYNIGEETHGRPTEPARPGAEEGPIATEATERPGERAAPAGREPSRQAGAQVKPVSFLRFLAQRGGLKPDPELSAVLDGNPFVPGRGRLVRKTGMTLDEAWEAAVEGGYISDAAALGHQEGPVKTGQRELLDLISKENRGEKQHPIGEQPAESGVNRDEQRHFVESELTALLKESGLDPRTVLDDDIVNRVHRLVEKEGHRDLLDAYERAVMESSSEREAKIIRGAVGEDAYDAGPASEGGGGLEAAGPAGQARRDTVGTEAGGPARRPGVNDLQAQRPGPDAAARAKAFAELAQDKGRVNDPQVVEASQRAQALPEPLSTAASKSLAYAEKLAAEAEELFKASAEGKIIPEEFKAKIDEIVRKAREYEVDWEGVIKDSGICLAAATT